MIPAKPILITLALLALVYAYVGRQKSDQLPADAIEAREAKHRVLLCISRTLRALFVLLLALLAGCAPTRPDPGKYCYAADNKPIYGRDYAPCFLDKVAFDKAQDEADRKNWRCLLADWGTTVVGLGVGLSEANPMGILYFAYPGAYHV